MQWLEIWIDTDGERVSELCERLECLGVSGLIIEDESDFRKFLSESQEYWDYVDEELMDYFSQKHRIKFYLESGEAGYGEMRRIEAALDVALHSKTIEEEDWATSWKSYYRPIEIGERLLILPEWEEPPETERIILRLDPGLIFGTGSHPTTKICLEALEEYVGGGERVLDLGCGSGILGIASILLGAARVTGCDIDEMAPKIALENAALNGIDENFFKISRSDILADVELKSELEECKYNLILANIVADVIIKLAPLARNWLAPGGVFICSGIIEGRQDEVRGELERCGYNILGAFDDADWHGYICK